MVAYRDEYNATTGIITRKVGTKVLDGSEDVMIRSEADKRFLVYGIASNAVDGGHIICTHFSGGTSDNLDTIAVGEISAMSSAAKGRFSIRFSDISTVAGVKQWLADQYNAGTPVIIVYPLATETTESVAGQTLQVTDGDNVAEITQASMSGLQLEAKYKAGAELQIEEI